MKIPVGYRSEPTHEEIILDYVYNKTHGFPLSSSSAVIECNIYEETDTWKKFFEATREITMFFFTKLRKKSEKGSRAERATRNGTWRSQSDKADLYNGGDRRQPMGYKWSFTSVSKKNGEEKGKWMVHENRLHESLLMMQEGRAMVVCRIKKKVSKEERRRSKLMTRNSNESLLGGGQEEEVDLNEGINVEELESIYDG